MPGTALRLLPARVRHANAVAQLVQLGAPTSQHVRWDAARIGRRIRSPNSALVLAASGRYLAGAAVLDLLSEEAQLSLLVVHPHYRRIGIGSALLGWVETTASTAGLFTLQLKLEASNGAGRAFCFAHHYRERGRLPAFYPDGSPAIRLVRNLRVNSEPA